MPLPPEIIILADVNSGLSDLVNSSLIYSEMFGIFSGFIFSTSHPVSLASAALYAVGLIVKTFFASEL